jgi:hypothetical protein
MYFMTRTPVEKTSLINTIQSILSQNSQFDPMHSRNRAALANTLIDEYNSYHAQQRGSKTIEQLNQLRRPKSSSVESIYTQVNWWKLLPELISSDPNESQSLGTPSESSAPAPPESVSSTSLRKSLSHLISVIQLHQEEVIDTIISMINEKSLTTITPLLTNKHLHYPIACDWFFEGNPKILSFSNQDFHRPNLLRLFLFHDLLLVTTVPTKEGKHLYAYHIQIKDLQVIDFVDTRTGSSQDQPLQSPHQQGGGASSENQIVTCNSDSFTTTKHSLCLKLIDHSVKSKGFFSSLWSSSSPNGQEHLLLASTIQQKQAWYELFNETIRSSQKKDSPFRTGLHSSPIHSVSFPSLNDENHEQNEPSGPLIRRISSSGDGVWKYDERVSESDITFQSIL